MQQYWGCIAMPFSHFNPSVVSEDQSRKEFCLVASSPYLVYYKCSYWDDVAHFRKVGVATKCV